MKPQGKNGRAAGGRGRYSGESYILGVSDGRVLGCVRVYRLRLVVLLFCTEHVFGGYKVFFGMWRLWSGHLFLLGNPNVIKSLPYQSGIQLPHPPAPRGLSILLFTWKLFRAN